MRIQINLVGGGNGTLWRILLVPEISLNLAGILFPSIVTLWQHCHFLVTLVPVHLLFVAPLIKYKINPYFLTQKSPKIKQQLQSESVSRSVVSDFLWHMDCSPPGSSVHGISQAKILECVVIPFSRGSSWPRAQIQVSCIAGRFFTIWATREAQGT